MGAQQIIVYAFAIIGFTFPVMAILYDMVIKYRISNLRLEIEKEVLAKFDSFKKDLNLDHKKLSTDNLDKISKRLLLLANRIDPKGTVYEDFND